MENSLQHWGIKGMKWGIRRFQNKDGSLTPAGKKRREQEADPEEAKRQREEAKQKAIKSGTATEVMKFRGELDSRELQTALDRLDKEKRVRDLSAEEIKNHKTKADKFFEKVDKGVKYAEIGAKAWNTIANVRNAFFSSGVSWPKIEVDVLKGNKAVRKAEKKAQKEEVDKAKAEREEAAKKEAEAAAKAKAEKEAKKAAKEREKAEKEPEDNSESSKNSTKGEKWKVRKHEDSGDRETIDMELDPDSGDIPRYTRAGKDRVDELFKELKRNK